MAMFAHFESAGGVQPFSGYSPQDPGRQRAPARREEGGLNLSDLGIQRLVVDSSSLAPASRWMRRKKATTEERSDLSRQCEP